MEIVLDRLERNLSIINSKRKSYIEVEQRKSNGKELTTTQKCDLTYQLAMELITWIINTDDLLFKNVETYKNIKKQDKKYSQTMFGIRHAFNLFKHNMNILSVEEIRHTLLFKNEDNNYYLENTVWLNVDNLEIEPEQINARKAYQETIEGRSLFETFNYIVWELSKYSRNIFNEYKDIQN